MNTKPRCFRHQWPELQRHSISASYYTKPFEPRSFSWPSQ
jgi:hypothetical protein